MSNEDTNRLNLFDFMGFPDRLKRDEALKICDINKIYLLQVEDVNLHFLIIF